MNQQSQNPQNLNLLTYDAEGPMSERNMSYIHFINYYKDPYYHFSGGLITEIYIRAFSNGNKYLGMNFNPEEISEELAQEQAGLMDFHNCDFHLIRDNKNSGLMTGECSVQKYKIEHNNDLLVTSRFHSDVFDSWLNTIQNRKNSRIDLKIEFNQAARDTFIGSLMMNALGDYEEESDKIYFHLSSIGLNLRAYESYPKPQLSHPTA